jgi:citrate lyase beta subunit
MSQPRRALLFMPGDDLRKIAKGAALDVDSVIMDLEDGVALNRKVEARERVIEGLRTLDFGETERLVRINALGTGLARDDVAATVVGRPDGYVIPKVESAEDVRQVSWWLAETETAQGWAVGTIRLIGLIETARGVMRLDQIAGADSRLAALAFGAEDLAGDLGATRTAEGWEVYYARSAVVVAAAAYGLQALDTPFVGLHDEAGLAADARRAAGMGYTGKMAIHPRHIGPIIAAFTPAAEVVAAAERLVRLFREHQAHGTGVFELDGKMVDQPMVRAAERVLARAAKREDQ